MARPHGTIELSPRTSTVIGAVSQYLTQTANFLKLGPALNVLPTRGGEIYSLNQSHTMFYS